MRQNFRNNKNGYQKRNNLRDLSRLPTSQQGTAGTAVGRGNGGKEMITPQLISRIKSGLISEAETDMLHRHLRKRANAGDRAVLGDYKRGYSTLAYGYTVGVGTFQRGSNKFRAFAVQMVEMPVSPPVSSRWVKPIPFNGEPIQNNAPETGRESIGLEAR
jgi:hypothetical protein